MNNTVVGIVSFIGGAALAAFVTYKVVDKRAEEKYEALFQEELASVKEKFTVPKANPVKDFVDSVGSIPADTITSGKISSDKIDKVIPEKPSLKVAYARSIEHYTNYSNRDYEPEREEKGDKTVYVVTPEEFAEDDTYETQELTLYADGILADTDDTILDADEVVGKGSLDRMGEYEDDTLHVKNEKRKLYYEILADERSYEDATGKTPHLDKDEED